MKKKIIIIVAIMVIAGGLIIFLGGSGEEAERAASGSQEQQVDEDELNEISVYGTVEAREVRNLRLSTPVLVEEVYVREGQRVNEGDELMALDLSEGQAELKEKSSNLESLQEKNDTFAERWERKKEIRKKELTAAESRLEYEQNRLQRLESELESEDSPEFEKLKQKLSAAERDYRRYKEKLKERKKLRENEAITREEFENFEETFQEREDALNELQISLEELQVSKENQKEEVESLVAEQEKTVENLRRQMAEYDFERRQEQLSLEGEIETTRARVKQLEQQFNRSYIEGDNLVAIFDRAVVYSINHRPGDSVEEGGTLMEILDMDSLLVEAEVSEDYIGDIREGQEVKVIPLADNSRDYRGEVIRISGRAVEEDVETIIPVEIEIEEPDEFLIPGMNVDVTISPENNETDQ